MLIAPIFKVDYLSKETETQNSKIRQVFVFCLQKFFVLNKYINKTNTLSSISEMFLKTSVPKVMSLHRAGTIFLERQ